MKLTLLAKSAESGKAGCPSVYLAEDGSLVVQGHLLDPDTEGNLLNVLPDEGAVRIEASIVRAALTQM
ncbi:MAG: hypothetical protein ACRDSH_16620 [Pseudonocardiaceae bacterium]